MLKWSGACAGSYKKGFTYILGRTRLAGRLGFEVFRNQGDSNSRENGARNANWLGLFRVDRVRGAKLQGFLGGA